MIALDTNVLVRLLVADDAKQAGLAQDLVRSMATRSEDVLLTHLALCELVWVLGGAYDAPKKTIIATLNRLSQTRPFVCEGPGRVRRAIDRYTAGKGDFSDYLLGESAASCGAGTVYTFDRGLRDEEGFTLL